MLLEHWPNILNLHCSECTLDWDPEIGSILDFAEEHDIAIDSGCRAGNCGTCITAIKEGKINIFSESISGTQALIYGNKVKRKIIKGNDAIVKLKATANDLSNISSSTNLFLNILNTL